MIDALFNQTNYVALKKMLDATALRHEAIANNIAHVEVPRYQRIDLAPSFAEELRQAVSAGGQSQVSQIKPRVEVDRTAIARTRDGNTVQLEDELLKMNQNAVAHQMEVQMLTASLLKLRLAITGRSS
ncbi:MAG TPA: flagellar basal body rod protein FlgB [Candidatus Paceibacterota bacterium]|nr:flagellar basal body rod protein FlgB [Verrucomicrobiota bacterium]HRY47466.1 flagellar basal body rod protein FlgB [Candidatus Paceibacterota bacterium]